MKFGAVPPARLREQLAGPGVRLRLGHITIRIATGVATLIPQFQHLYGDHCLIDGEAIDDCLVGIRHASRIRRFVAPIVRGELDGRPGFLPLPASAAIIMLESCLNWAVINNGLGRLLIHAAALERDGRAVILPAVSGSGKSTLCAALVADGWRLLTDETTIIRPDDGAVLPLARPISLKNESIAVARGLFGDAAMSAVFPGMPKGDMAYLRPPAGAVARIAEPALPALIVSPRFVAGHALEARRLRPVDAFGLLLDNAVNYPEMQRTGFDLVQALATRCPAYALRYGELRAALDFIARAHVPAIPA